MIVRKAFQYRLHPTKKQHRLLEMQLSGCQWLYNELLSQRKMAYEELDLTLTKYQQLMFLPALKLEKPELGQIHSQVLQNVVDRLDKAFQGFFRRCKAGEKLALCDRSFYRLKRVKTPGFNDREASCILLILRACAIVESRGFRVGPNQSFMPTTV
jgi:transposase